MSDFLFFLIPLLFCFFSILEIQWTDNQPDHIQVQSILPIIWKKRKLGSAERRQCNYQGIPTYGNWKRLLLHHSWIKRCTKLKRNSKLKITRSYQHDQNFDVKIKVVLEGWAVIVSRLTLLLWPFWYLSCNTLLV